MSVIKPPSVVAAENNIGREKHERKLSAISYQLSAISYQLSAISYRWIDLGGFVVKGVVWTVTCDGLTADC
jgi:hypothetical protein